MAFCCFQYSRVIRNSRLGIRSLIRIPEMPGISSRRRHISPQGDGILKLRRYRSEIHDIAVGQRMGQSGCVQRDFLNAMHPVVHDVLDIHLAAVGGIGKAAGQPDDVRKLGFCLEFVDCRAH